MTTSIRRARTAFLWVGVLLPLLILVTAAIILLAWLPQAPNPSAIHWSADAGPDGFGPPLMNLVPIGIGVVLVLAFAGLTLVSSRGTSKPQKAGAGALTSRHTDPSTTGRLLGAVSLGFSAMLGLVAVAVAGVQRGLTDARNAGSIDLWLLIGFGLLVGLSVIGWFLQPKSERPELLLVDAEPLPMGPQGRAVWFGTASMARSGWVTLIVLFGVMFLFGVFVLAGGAGGSSAAGWILIGTAVLMAAMVAMMFEFRVRVDSSGLLARSVAGWPRIRIAATAIARVGTVEVNPFAEFGGWGYRIGTDGRRGIVLRNGPALEVVRRDGRIFVVTVDEAEEAAAVLQAARARAGETHA